MANRARVGPRACHGAHTVGRNMAKGARGFLGFARAQENPGDAPGLRRGRGPERMTAEILSI